MRQLILSFSILFLLSAGLRAVSLSDLSTDKARYAPGERIVFNLQLENSVDFEQLTVVYFQGWKPIDSAVVNVTMNPVTWNWIAPAKDYTGYLVRVMIGNQDIEIAVDVSSDWRKFPRYGFLSKFGQMTEDDIDRVIANLNRHHINGLQFYDWHWKHHKPLAGNPTNPDNTWPDIANRTIYRETVENYITSARDYNMQAMAYNLLYGAFEDASSDGVSEQWRMYHDTNHQNPVNHDLPDSWASDIYVMDHTNSTWRNYIAAAMGNVFKAFDFDGWHVDQLGSNGQTKYTYDGDAIFEASGFKGFLNDMQEKLDVPLVMNAVDQFAQNYIAQAPVEFLYTEVWSETDFGGLIDVINTNYFYRADLQTVLAAYVNKNYNDTPRQMNTPAVLLADAVIFANGGAHLELGEHMLSSEYFPYDDLGMSAKLRTAMIRYYDFATAYENFLRDQLESLTFAAIGESGYELSKSAKKNTIWIKGKKKDNLAVLHFINLMGVTTLEWRDSQGSQTMPETQYNVPIVFKADSVVKNVYLCSPDFQSIAMQPVPFSQPGDELRFALDSLKVWDMVVVEFEGDLTAIEQEVKSAGTFNLMPNYPNPFNATTHIRFNVPEQGLVRLQVFDNSGNKISDRSFRATAGYNEVPFQSVSLSSGIYFYRLLMGPYWVTDKMVLLK